MLFSTSVFQDLNGHRIISSFRKVPLDGAKTAKATAAGYMDAFSGDVGTLHFTNDAPMMKCS